MIPVFPSRDYPWTFRQIVWATVVLVALTLGFWLLLRFYHVLFILFIAIVMGTAIRPAVTWLHDHGLTRRAGVTLVYVVSLALIGGFLLLLFPLLVEQGTTIAVAVPDYYQNLREWMAAYPNQLIGRLGEFLPVTLPDLEPIQQTGPQLLATAGQALGYVTVMAEIGLTTVVILLLAFHWTLDGPRIIRSLLLLMPHSQRESISELIAAMEVKVGAYIAGQGILCLVVGLMALVAYLLIGLPNALVLALAAGVMEAVPLVGPLLGAIPAAVIAVSIAPSKLLWVIVATIVIQQLENSILVPRIMRKAVGVNPFVSLLAIFAFSSLLGLAGALMAIPMAAILQLLFDRFVFDPATRDAEVATGRDSTSRLRYDAQDLVQDLRRQARFSKAGSDLAVAQIDQVVDEIETIATDLDYLLARVQSSGVT